MIENDDVTSSIKVQDNFGRAMTKFIKKKAGIVSCRLLSMTGFAPVEVHNEAFTMNTLMKWKEPRESASIADRRWHLAHRTRYTNHFFVS